MAELKLFEVITAEGKGILAELDDQGIVTFAISAGEASSIRGIEMFNAMMRYYGDEVRAIRGVWQKNQQGNPSTNIDEVNELTRKGMPIEEAIKYVWTVTRAAKHGFRKVTLVDAPVGVPGAYQKVNVLIEK